MYQYIQSISEWMHPYIPSVSSSEWMYPYNPSLSLRLDLPPYPFNRINYNLVSPSPSTETAITACLLFLQQNILISRVPYPFTRTSYNRFSPRSYNCVSLIPLKEPAIIIFPYPFNRTSYGSMSKWIQRRGEIVQPKGRVPKNLLDLDNPTPKFTKKRPIIKPSPAGMPSMYDTYLNNSSAVVSFEWVLSMYARYFNNVSVVVSPK